MDALDPKKASLKRRASLSLLFGSQKPPTFAAPPDDKPTRYYHFVDSPSPPNAQSHLISRQYISREVESEIRYACSLLAHRIEHGVPSRGNDPVIRRAVRAGSVGNIRTNAHLPSKYPSSKFGPEGAVTTGYDSGVGLTQQPSMQTMRVLSSRSGDASDSGDTRTMSVFSNSNTRTGTSCSNTSAINSTEVSCTQASSHSPRPSKPQSITRTIIPDSPRQQKSATNAFLADLSPCEPLPFKGSIPENTEVFLNPTSAHMNLSSETLTTDASPSLGLSRHNDSTQRPTTSVSASESDTKRPQSRSIIIDSTGQARLLTPDEESQRNKDLQKAVVERMTTGMRRYNPTNETSTRPCRPSTAGNNVSGAYRYPQPQSRPQTSASKFSFSWTNFKSDFDGLKRKDQSKKGMSRSCSRLRGGVPLIGKLAGFFMRERSGLGAR